MNRQIDAEAMISQVDSALLSVDRLGLKKLFEDSGRSPLDFAEMVLVPALHSIGERWSQGSLSLAQVYMGGRISEELLKELLPDGRQQMQTGPAMAVVVLEDFHVLGKQLVCSVLRSAGYSFTDYGPLALDELLERIKQDNIQILLISTLMLSSALRIKTLKERLVDCGSTLKLVVGGAPFRFDPNLWHEVGADAYSPTASGVVGLLHGLFAEVQHECV